MVIIKLTTAIDRKLKAQGYIKVSESEYGAVFVKAERFGVAEIRIYKTSDDVLIESVFTMMDNGTGYKTTQYAMSHKVLKLVDRKIRELGKQYQWSVSDDNTGSRKADTDGQSE